jgi:hypothetical protein
MLQIDNKNRISINKIPINYWCKMLIEVYALVINSQTNTFSLFLRPIILSFKEKQSKIYNYKFLEDSDSDKDEIVCYVVPKYGIHNFMNLYRTSS